MRKSTPILASCGILALAAFLWFLWPTPFLYSRQGLNLFRTNRFTGVMETATSSGWQTIDVVQRAAADSVAAKEQESKAATERRRDGRSLEAVTVGAEGEYKAELRVAHWDGRTHYEMTLSPYNGGLRRAMESAGRAQTICTLKIYNASGFALGEQEISRDQLTRVIAEQANGSDQTSASKVGRVTLGKLGQTTRPTSIEQEPGGRIYYRAKANEYLVLRTSDKPGTYKVLLQNGREGYVRSDDVVRMARDVTAPADRKKARPPEPVKCLQAESSIVMSPEAYDQIRTFSLSWRW